MTPLLLAAHSGDNGKLAELISSGSADVNEKSAYGWTALMFAAWQGHADCVKTLLSAGADPDVLSMEVPSSFLETRGGYPPTTALREAIQGGHFAIVQLLLDKGARIDGTAIALAARTGDIPLVERLVKLGANVNEKSESAFYASPLCAASATGKLEMVQWLVSHGADPNLVALRHTPLVAAIEADEVRIVKYLLENGAEPNLVINSGGDTALLIAVVKSTDRKRYQDNLSVIRLLLSHGADKNYRGYDGETALDRIELQLKNMKFDEDCRNPEYREGFLAELEHMRATIALLEE
jgi:ankyrin repeat protein